MKTLIAFYDLAFGPVSYDFVTWLVRAMFERDRHGCQGLHVVIVPKEDGIGGFARDWGGHDEAAARWRLWHIAIASCPLARATVTIAHSRGQARALKGERYIWWPEGKAHFMGPLVEAGRAGKDVPRLRATAAAKRYVGEWLGNERRPVATLTTRQQISDQARNSQMEEWRKVREMLEACGYRVEMLLDTQLELSAGRGYAALDPDLRLALYEQAKMNIIGNNGPQELLKFSDAPYMIFGLAMTDGWREHFDKYFYMKPGDQMPWARQDQRMIYRPDTFDVMREEFGREPGKG